MKPKTIARCAYNVLITALIFSSATYAMSNDDISCKQIRIQAVLLDAKTDLPDSVVATLKSHRIITIGEIHGSDEAPAFVGRLADQLTRDGSPLLVALEINRDNQQAIDQFSKTGDETILQSLPHFNFNRGFEDGRSSIAMAMLLKKLRTNPLIQILAFDQGASSAQQRDEQMAKYLIKVITEQPRRLLILAGSVHAAPAIGTGFDPNYRPMAYELSHQEGSCIKTTDIYAVKIENQRGQTWSLVDGKSGPHTREATHRLYDEAVSWNSYFLPLPHPTRQGYNAILFIRTLTASPPYVQPSKS